VGEQRLRPRNRTPAARDHEAARERLRRIGQRLDDRNGNPPDAGPTRFDWSAVGWLTDRVPELELVFRAAEGDWRWNQLQGRYVRFRSP
jgi:hypothetical protein